MEGLELMKEGVNMTKKEIEIMREKAKASCTTVDTMRDFVVQSCDDLLKERVLEAYFKVEDFLYSNGKDKPLEIQSAILWGALLVVHNHGDIDWNEMRKMYGEFMSKKMNLR